MEIDMDREDWKILVTSFKQSYLYFLETDDRIRLDVIEMLGLAEEFEEIAVKYIRRYGIREPFRSTFKAIFERYKREGMVKGRRELERVEDESTKALERGL